MNSGASRRITRGFCAITEARVSARYDPFLEAPHPCGASLALNAHPQA
jgi:hypothetical protein